jgi:hypothetical protein
MRRAAIAAVFVVACSDGQQPQGAPDVAVEAAPEAGGGDTWTNYAQGFFATYCVSCHNSSDATGRDFTQQAIVVANKATIRCGVAVTQDTSWTCGASPTAKQFPIGTGPKPTDAERDRIVAWITAGAP